jgi:Transposase IS116/IS110/IS902 family
MRELTRAREAAVVDLRSKRQQVSAFLLRHELRHGGKRTWTKAHMSWLAGLKLAHLEQRIAFEEMLLAVRQAGERLERLEQAIRAAVEDWSLREVVPALMAMRGIDLISATAFLAEVGDLSRFRTPRQLMAYLGLVPSEDSPARRSSAARSPRPATAAPAASWWRAPGATSIRRGSAKTSSQGGSGAASGRRDRLEGAVPAVRALSLADPQGQAQDRRRHRGGTRACRLHLGDQPRAHHGRCCRQLSGPSREEIADHHHQGAEGRGSGPANMISCNGGSASRGGEFPRIALRPIARSTPVRRQGQPRTNIRTCENPRIRGC